MLRFLHRQLQAVSAHAAPGRFLAVNLAIGLGHFLVLFNGGAYLPMIPRVIAALGRNPLYGSWTQDLYFLALGLG
ncbi:MAG: MFS transporter, partial [Acidithiobacillus sp.]